MNERIHYLMLDPNRKGLIYPTELDDQAYMGKGSFYLLDFKGYPIRDSYTFYAIHGEQILTFTLHRNLTRYFQVEVINIGVFDFLAVSISNQLSYIGNEQETSGLIARRRLKALHPERLDQACIEHDFYFVGYTPRLRNI